MASRRIAGITVEIGGDTTKLTTALKDVDRKLFYTAREALRLDPLHRLHDGRTHFVTAAKKNGMDEYAIKYIVGHQISDLTERVYTKRNVEWLREEMEKIV